MSRPRSCDSDHAAPRLGGLLRPHRGAGARRPAARPRSAPAPAARDRRSAGLALDPDGEDRHLGVAGVERPVAASAEVAVPGEVGELDARRRRDQQLAGVRVRERRPRALERVRLVEQAEVAARPPGAVRGREAKLLAVAPGHRLGAFAVEHDLRGGLAVEPSRELGRVLAALRQPVDHARPVRGGHEHAVHPGEGRLQRDRPVDPGLAVIGADHDRVALEELVRPARGLDQRADRGIAPRQRLLRLLRAERVGREVVVGQVVDEEVEAVAGDEPAPDEPGVGVDRAGRSAENRHRCAGHVGFEEVVEEEALRPVRRPDEPRDERHVRGPAAIAGDVDRGCGQARVLERLVDRDRVCAEMLLVHVVDRVEERPARAGGADGRERGAVLDQPPLAAVVPDQVRNVVHVRVRAGRDRRQADRRERRERRDPAAVAAVRGEERERRGAAGLDRVLEDRGGEPVDHDEDQLLALGQRP